MKIERNLAIVLAVAVLILLAFAFAFGTSVGQRAMLRRATAELNGIQAMLAFNRIQDERHVQELISRGCADRAAEFIRYTSDQNLELLSGFVKGPIDSGTLHFLADRDPKILTNSRASRAQR